MGVEKSAANKEINNKKVLATSYANFARSRTVTDKTCSAPNNFLGCQNAAELRHGGAIRILPLELSGFKNLLSPANPHSKANRYASLRTQTTCLVNGAHCATKTNRA